jgi:hypothetical protein
VWIDLGSERRSLESTAGVDVEALRITDVSLLSPGVLRLTWDAVSNLTYRVQYASSPGGGPWMNLGGLITATGTTASVNVANGPDSARYYRIIKP